jgi:hypothetical protein
MRLPTSTDLVNFNYLMIVIYTLSVDGWCSIKAVHETCAQRTFNAQIIDYRKIIEVLEYCDLLVTKRGKVSITDKGSEFVRLNEHSFLELNPKQKYFLAENCMFYGRYKSQAKRIFNTFVSDHNEMTYKYNWSDKYEVPINDKITLHVFEYLGIVIRREAAFAVDPKYLKHVREIRAETRGITQEELERSLDTNRKLGFKAEELVVEYERKRLSELGLDAEADRVKRISVLDPEAGYDIRSFIGTGPTAEHDKFIEVKSSQKSGVEFYWTKNEIDVAQKLGDQYWIYFLPDFSDSAVLKDINPLAIKNPADVVLNNHAFECEPRLFKVTESGNRKFKKLDDEARDRLIRLSYSS